MLPSEYLVQGWCQGTTARNQAGNRVAPRDPRANKWCFMGAMGASGMGGVLLWKRYRDKALELLDLHKLDLPRWNDHIDRTQAEVVALAWRVEMALGLRPNVLVEEFVETATPLRDGLVEELALVN